MRLKDIVTSINDAVDALNYAAARKFIEDNFEMVYQHRHLLNNNAREIFKFVQKNMNSEEEPLTKEEIKTIMVINTYATKFDIRGLKLNVKGKEQLFLKKQVVNYLNADAKILLEGLGVIRQEEQLVKADS